MRKHPTVKLTVSDEDQNKNISGMDMDTDDTCSTSASENVKMESLENFESESQALSTSLKSVKVKQSKVTGYVRKKVPFLKKIDDSFLLLFIKDLQLFSVVEDFGFRKFVNDLNPNYQLPSRRTITDTYLTAAYEQRLEEVEIELAWAKAVTLTTDSWTSRNTESFLGVTAHYLKNDYELNSVLLGCVSFKGSHTGTYYATKISELLKKWNLDDKILMVISDNAANIKKAIKDDLKLKHFGCYAHTLNLIARDALNNIECINSKIRAIVGHFKRSNLHNDIFLEKQKKMEEKLKNLYRMSLPVGTLHSI